MMLHSVQLALRQWSKLTIITVDVHFAALIDPWPFSTIKVSLSFMCCLSIAESDMQHAAVGLLYPAVLLRVSLTSL